MDFKVGDTLTRISYNNDTIFKIINIEEDIFYLKGINIRLYADSLIEDLQICDKDIEKDRDFLNSLKKEEVERNDYFYLPGKILHIDGDEDYLNRCL